MVDESEDFFKISTRSGVTGLEFYLDDTEEEIDAIILSEDIPIPDTGEKVDMLTLYTDEEEEEFDEKELEKSYIVESKSYEYARAGMDVDDDEIDESLISVVKIHVREVEE